MGCLVTAYGPPVRSWCPALTVGAALHIAPSASLAHTANAVAATRMTRPRIAIQARWKATAFQAERGTAKSSATTMATPGQRAEPNQERVRSGGACGS